MALSLPTAMVGLPPALRPHVADKTRHAPRLAFPFILIALYVQQAAAVCAGLRCRSTWRPVCEGRPRCVRRRHHLIEEFAFAWRSEQARYRRDLPSGVEIS
jgi:hypothetical protein